VAAHGPIVFQNQSQPANQPALMTRQGTLLANNSVQPQSPNGPIINIPAHNSSNDSTNHYDLSIQQLITNSNLNPLPNRSLLFRPYNLMRQTTLLIPFIPH
jgi:hypothetical protein